MCKTNDADTSTELDNNALIQSLINKPTIELLVGFDSTHLKPARCTCVVYTLTDYHSVQSPFGCTQTESEASPVKK
jgi:hypothetical protein